MIFASMFFSALVAAVVTWFTMWLVLSMEEKSNGTIEGFGIKRRAIQRAAEHQLEDCRHVWGPWETIQEETKPKFQIIQQRECEVCQKRSLDVVTLDVAGDGKSIPKHWMPDHG